jgi:microcystin-dependent protein
MSEPFLAEIRIVSFAFAPKGWALCNGQLLPINQNQALFALLGTTYGGNGTTTFALPDLRGRTAIHFGSAHFLGERSGEEAHTLVASEMPQHAHVVQATGNDGTTVVPTGNVLARVPARIYESPASLTTLRPETVTVAGGSQPHTNMQPYLVLSFVIALQGIFPSRN